VFKNVNYKRTLILKYKFMEFNYYVGIDVSKNTLDVAVNSGGKILMKFRCENSKNGIKQLVKEMRMLPGFKMRQSVFCMEYTGVYNNHLLECLLACKTSIWMEPALKIKQSQGMKRGKTDSIDAVRIAEYAYTFRENVRLWVPARDEVKKLKLLITLRDRLVNSIKELSVPVKENAQFVSADHRKTEERIMSKSIQAMQKSLAAVDKEIDELIKKDEQLKKMYDLVTSVTGVGPVVAVNVIAVTEEFKKFDDANKFSCYSGVVPFDNTSGSSIRGRSKVSHLANKKIKTLMHLAAMAAITAKGELRDYYQRKIAQGKNKMSVINAIRNKIIHRIFAVIKRQSPYQKNYLNPIA
jgi:transposase